MTHRGWSGSSGGGRTPASAECKCRALYTTLLLHALQILNTNEVMCLCCSFQSCWNTQCVFPTVTVHLINEHLDEPIGLHHGPHPPPAGKHQLLPADPLIQSLFRHRSHPINWELPSALPGAELQKEALSGWRGESQSQRSRHMQLYTLHYIHLNTSDIALFKYRQYVM